VFTTQAGRPIDPSNLRHAFAPLSEKRWARPLDAERAAPLGRPSAFGAGGPLEVIADVVGHASTRMLESTTGTR
jgi:hypothetical protein